MCGIYSPFIANGECRFCYGIKNIKNIKTK